MNAIDSLIDHVLLTRFEDLPTVAVAAAKTFIFDSVGVGISGARHPRTAQHLPSVKSWTRAERGVTRIESAQRRRRIGGSRPSVAAAEPDLRPFCGHMRRGSNRGPSRRRCGRRRGEELGDGRDTAPRRDGGAAGSDIDRHLTSV